MPAAGRVRAGADRRAAGRRRPRRDLARLAPVPPAVRLARRARGRGDRRGRVRLAAARPDAAPWLAVTGTNGKTTTVRMLESILQAAGLRAIAVGNVGVSIIDAVLAGDRYDVLAVELSSFQLYWSSTVRPLAGAILNLAPDHLDWHGSMADYVEAKARIWSAEVAIANRGRLGGRATCSRRAPTSTVASSSPWASRWTGSSVSSTGQLVDRAFGAGALFPAADVRPSGAHNVANALAASALAACLRRRPGGDRRRLARVRARPASQSARRDRRRRRLRR